MPITPIPSEAQIYTLGQEFKWVGAEQIIWVGGTFAGEEIAVEFEVAPGMWIPGAESGDPAYFDLVKGALQVGSPGMNTRFANFAAGTGAGLTLAISDVPEGSNRFNRKTFAAA